jgi:hypothetical protein
MSQRRTSATPNEKEGIVMSVGSVSGNGAVESSPSIVPVSAVSGTGSIGAGGGGAGDSSGVSGVSSMASMLQQLQQLQQTDPSQLQQVVSGMASSLRAEAQQTGGAAAQVLWGFAAKLTQVAQTGDLSALSPQGAKAGASVAPQSTRAYSRNAGGGSQVERDILGAFSSALSSVRGTSAASTTYVPSTWT